LTVACAAPRDGLTKNPRAVSAVCANASSDQTSDITISDLHEPIQLTPPAGSLDVVQFGR
jgi:hypothetical protein